MEAIDGDHGLRAEDRFAGGGCPATARGGGAARGRLRADRAGEVTGALLVQYLPVCQSRFLAAGAVPVNRRRSARAARGLFMTDSGPDFRRLSSGADF